LADISIDGSYFYRISKANFIIFYETPTPVSRSLNYRIRRQLSVKLINKIFYCYRVVITTKDFLPYSKDTVYVNRYELDHFSRLWVIAPNDKKCL